MNWKVWQPIPPTKVVVRGLSREDIKDIYQIRLMIEGMTARRAAENITEEELAELKEYIELKNSIPDVMMLSSFPGLIHASMKQYIKLAEAVF